MRGWPATHTLSAVDEHIPLHTGSYSLVWDDKDRDTQRIMIYSLTASRSLWGGCINGRKVVICHSEGWWLDLWLPLKPMSKCPWIQYTLYTVE